MNGTLDNSGALGHCKAVAVGANERGCVMTVPMARCVLLEDNKSH